MRLPYFNALLFFVKINRFAIFVVLNFTTLYLISQFFREFCLFFFNNLKYLCLIPFEIDLSLSYHIKVIKNVFFLGFSFMEKWNGKKKAPEFSLKFVGISGELCGGFTWNPEEFQM